MRTRVTKEQARSRLLGQLTASLASPHIGCTDDILQRDAAFEVARNLGYCRLFGVEEPEAESNPVPMCVEWALDAADGLNTRLRRWCVESMCLASNWAQARTFCDANELCLGQLENRMDSWAVCTALDVALCAAKLDGRPLAKRLSDKLQEAQQHLDRFDEMLQREAELLSTATETELLNNWRRLLSDPYNDTLPWWLAGTLEDAAVRAAENAKAKQANKDVWATVWHKAKLRRSY